MGKFIDRVGLRYGRLVVLSDAGVDHSKKRLWKCLCDCGKETTVTAGSLATGNTISCGCYHLGRITKHGGWKKSSYNTWRAMLRRCQNPGDKDYARYGGKGITVCPEWQEYTRFAADMGEPGEGESLDRIDGSRGYSKDNCRWASAHTQAVNSKPRTSTGHRGVVYLPRYKKWLASITVAGHRHYSRVQTSLENAVAARGQLESQHWKSCNE
jgi:hypothetical protein